MKYTFEECITMALNEIIEKGNDEERNINTSEGVYELNGFRERAIERYNTYRNCQGIIEKYVNMYHDNKNE